MLLIKHGKTSCRISTENVCAHLDSRFTQNRQSTYRGHISLRMSHCGEERWCLGVCKRISQAGGGLGGAWAGNAFGQRQRVGCGFAAIASQRVSGIVMVRCICALTGNARDGDRRLVRMGELKPGEDWLFPVPQMRGTGGTRFWLDGWKGNSKGKGKGKSKGRSRFPAGMTDRRTGATAKATTRRGFGTRISCSEA